MKEFLSNKDLTHKKIKYGKNHQISSLARFYGSEINIGNNVRIDDDVVLKGKIIIKSNSHIARGCTLSGGKKGIFVGSFTAISNFVQIFGVTDDYFHPYVPAISTLNKKLTKKYSKLRSEKIIIGDCCIIGSMTIILPGGNIKDFSTVGANSIIYKDVNSGIYFSNRNKIDFERKRNLKMLKKRLKSLKNEIK